MKTTTSVWKQLLWKLCLSCLSCGLFAIAHLCPTLGKTLAPTCRLCSSVLPCSSDSVNPDTVSLYSPCFGVTEPADNQVTWLINISVIPQKGVEREATHGRYGGWGGGSSWLSHKWLSSIIHLKQSRPVGHNLHHRSATAAGSPAFGGIHRVYVTGTSLACWMTWILLRGLDPINKNHSFSLFMQVFSFFFWICVDVGSPAGHNHMNHSFSSSPYISTPPSS